MCTKIAGSVFLESLTSWIRVCPKKKKKNIYTILQSFVKVLRVLDPKTDAICKLEGVKGRGNLLAKLSSSGIYYSRAAITIDAVNCFIKEDR